MSSSISAWHKKQHKKQLLKNKTARIAARDAKVLETKSLSAIDEEIRALTRRYKKDDDNDSMPHAIRSKLDRLQKERKLLLQKDRETADVAKQQSSVSKSATVAFKPLERPQVSIYYDAIMNPYGEPPPGEPRLYHRKPSLGGGVTRNLDEAWVPGEPEPTFRQDREERPVEHRKERQATTDRRLDLPRPQTEKPTRSENRSSTSTERLRLSEPTRSKIETATTSTQRMHDPSKPPELPKASASVRRRGLQVDIWASSEEVAYEEAVGNFVGLDGSIVEERAPSDSQYFYRDVQHQVQGPFSLKHMQQWVQAGYFTRETLVKTSADKGFRPLGHIKTLAKLLPQQAAERNAGSFREEGTEDGGVQARIALLRQSEHRSATEADSVQDRIAALRKEKRPEDQNDSSSSVQDRIARLKEQDASERGIGSRLEEVPGDDDEEQEDTGIQARITALRNNGTHSGGVTEAKAFSAQSSMEGKVEVSFNSSETVTAADPFEFAYPVDQEDKPPAYPIAEDPNMLPDVAPYPIEDMEYPVSFEGEEEYPVTDDYPATGTYPYIDDTDAASEAYPVVEPYPTVEDSKEGMMDDTALKEPPKKRIKADKAVVAFVPSHLQRRKPKK